MNPELFELYEELVKTVDIVLPEVWETFKVSADYDESGLGLSLEYTDNEGRTIEFSPVTSPVFSVMRKVREASGPGLEWSEWIFDYNRTGKYNIDVKYPDSQPAN